VDIKLRLWQNEDLPLILAWRSNPLVYKRFYQQFQSGDAMAWEEHVAWNESRNSDWRNFIILYEGRPAGVVNIGQLDNWEPEIGVYIGELALWGKGIGKESVRLGVEWIRDYAKTHKHVVAVIATILDNNERSIKLFISLGFKRIADARPKESLYRKWLDCFERKGVHLEEDV